jgi:CP family cyanate transporter-like MFS transporter
MPAALVAGLLIAAFNLRIGITEVGPVVQSIRADTGLSRAWAGAITTIPFVCMGVFSFFGPLVLARAGAKRVIGWCLAVLALSTALRAIAPSGALVLAATLPLGIAVALAGIAIPSVIKHRFPDREGGATGAYAAAMNLGGAAASLAVVPLAAALGGWRTAFVASAAPALVALALWMSTDVGRGRPAVASPARLFRRPPARAVVLALIFAFQAVGFAGLIAWVAVIYREHGWSAGDAGLATAIVVLVAVPASILVPALSDGRDRRRWLAGGAATMAAGMVGIALVPTTGAWLWLTLFALGNGAVFPLAMTLPLDVSGDGVEAAEMMAWTLGLGYLLAGLSPTVVGALRDLSGSFALPVMVLALFGVLCAALTLRGVRPRGA